MDAANGGAATQMVPTPVGDARLLTFEAADPWARLVLGHGAGGGTNARDLTTLARDLPGRGVTVILVEQPWLVAGKRVAPRPERLDEAWVPALEPVPRDVPVIAGGRSAGARVACRTAQQVAAAAVVALAFPLHPPWKPERSRFAELAGAGVPALVVQGERDAFGAPDDFPDGDYQMVTIPFANHGMAVPKSQDQDAALARIVDSVAHFLRQQCG